MVATKLDGLRQCISTVRLSWLILCTERHIIEIMLLLKMMLFCQESTLSYLKNVSLSGLFWADVTSSCTVYGTTW